MTKEAVISILQDAVEFHDDVEKAYFLPDPGMALQEKYGKEGAYYIFTHADIYGEKIIIYQLADWNYGNRNYWIKIFANGVYLTEDIEFVKGLVKILKD